MGKSIDWTGATWTTALTFTGNDTSIFGSYTLISGLTYTNNATTLTPEGRGSFTLKCNGVSLGQSINLNAP